MLSLTSPGVVLSLPTVKQLEAGDFDLDELSKKLGDALANESQRDEILQLTGNIAALIIECLDKIMSSNDFRTNSDVQVRSRVFFAFSKLSRGNQYLPRSYWIDPATITLPAEPHTYGRCAEVYHGKQNGESVAVKILRVSNQENQEKVRKRFCREAVLWKHISCPYILKFSGAFYHSGVPAIVTPWMARGDITEYLKKHTDADRLHLLLCVVKGVRYLHNCHIAHGDIKPSNVFISDTTPPRAMLADFGLVRVTTISTKILNEEERVLPFTAPELLSTKFGLDRAVPSNEADIFALGMTIYQVLTGKVPLSQVGDAWIMQAVISGERPPKPEDADQIGMTDVVWDLLTECWREDRAKRPNISNILKRFCDITGQGKTTDSKLGLAAPGMHIGASHDSIRSDTQSRRSVDIGGRFGGTMMESKRSSLVYVSGSQRSSVPDLGKEHDTTRTPAKASKRRFLPWNHFKRFTHPTNP